MTNKRDYRKVSSPAYRQTMSTMSAALPNIYILTSLKMAMETARLKVGRVYYIKMSKMSMRKWITAYIFTEMS